MVSSHRLPSLPKAIRQTVSYARFFDYDLTSRELHHWLISPRTYSYPAVSRVGRLSDQPSSKRLARLKHSSAKLKLAQTAATMLSFIPTVQMVAVTGSLSMNNAKPSADIDLMVVTSSHTLWLTRLLVVPLVRLFFKSRLPRHFSPQGVTLKGAKRAPATSGEGHSLMGSAVLSKSTADAICLNLWLDNQALAVPPSKRNLYTAHEVLQILPLVNKNHTYQQFILANSWTKTYLANAYKGVTLKRASKHSWPFQGLTLKGGRRPGPSEAKEGQFLKSWLNLLAFRLQYAYMRPKITNEAVGLHSAFFHPRSLGQKLDQILQNTP